MYFDQFFSILGYVQVSASELGVSSISITDEPSSQKVHPNSHINLCIEQLEEFFAGRREQFDIPLDFGTHSGFYLQVWNELTKIPYGKTISYSELAQQIGHSKAVRAVGSANAKNPIAIVVPCHRVIGTKGHLTGYAHGLERKQKLLMLEKPKVFGMQTSLF